MTDAGRSRRFLLNLRLPYAPSGSDGMHSAEIAELRNRARRLWELTWDLMQLEDGRWTPESEAALAQCRDLMQQAMLLMERSRAEKDEQPN